MAPPPVANILGAECSIREASVARLCPTGCSHLQFPFRPTRVHGVSQRPARNHVLIASRALCSARPQWRSEFRVQVEGLDAFYLLWCLARRTDSAVDDRF